MSQPTAEQFLGLAPSSPSAKFPQMGATVTGLVLAPPQTRPQRQYKDPSQIEKWPDGEIMHQLVINLLTQERDPQVDGDTGVRNFYVNGNARGLKEALRDAIAPTGAKNAEVGGVLTVQWFAGEGREGDPKQYRAQYVRPTQETLQIVQQFNASQAPAEPQQQQVTPQNFLGAGQPAATYNTAPSAPAQPAQQWPPAPPVSPAWNQPQPAPVAAPPQPWGQQPQQAQAPVPPPAPPAAPKSYTPEQLAAVKAVQGNDPEAIRRIWPDYGGE